MEALKKKIEAVLFSAGKFISLEELCTLVKSETGAVKEALLSLQADFETNSASSLVVLNEGDLWKLTTREEYGSLVRNVVTQTELTKSQLETLAVIAFKYPIKQSDLIKIRTNKAYDHLTELEGLGFITRKKYGRSRLIKLTDKFFDYFDLPHDKLKERFAGFEQLASSIEGKEKKVEELKEQQMKLVEEAKREQEADQKIMDGHIELEDDSGETEKLEEYEKPKPPPTIEEAKDMVGPLEIVDVAEKKHRKRKHDSEDKSSDADHLTEDESSEATESDASKESSEISDNNNGLDDSQEDKKEDSPPQQSEEQSEQLEETETSDASVGDSEDSEDKQIEDTSSEENPPDENEDEEKSQSTDEQTKDDEDEDLLEAEAKSEEQ